MSRGPNRYYVADLDSPSTTNLLTPKQPSVQAALLRGPGPRIKSSLSTTSLVGFYYYLSPVFLLPHTLSERVPLSFNRG
jgi:hypothetical protein